MTADTLPRRTWHYPQPPAAYGMAGCPCGNADPQWSEYEGRLWCEPCGVDFVPSHGGVFDGPIPLHTSRLLGLLFDRIDLATGQVEPFVLDEPNRGPGPTPASILGDQA